MVGAPPPGSAKATPTVPLWVGLVSVRGARAGWAGAASRMRASRNKGPPWAPLSHRWAIAQVLRQRQAALEEAAVALLADEVAVLHHGLAAGEDDRWCSNDFAALVGVVVHLHVVGLGGDGVALLRVPDHHVRVGAGRERAL